MANVRKVYLYSPVSGEYAGTDWAVESPLEPGVFHVPAFATSTAPPKAAAGFAAIFDGKAWQLVPDFRKRTVYDTSTKLGQQWEAIGALPSTITELAPSYPDDVWSGSGWVTDTAAMKRRRTALITQECQAAALALSTGYMAAEVATWPQQEAEARAYTSDHDAATPLIDALSSARSVDKAALVAKIVTASDAYRTQIAGVIARERARLAALAAAVTPAEICAA